MRLILFDFHAVYSSWKLAFPLLYFQPLSFCPPQPFFLPSAFQFIFNLKGSVALLLPIIPHNLSQHSKLISPPPHFLPGQFLNMTKSWDLGGKNCLSMSDAFRESVFWLKAKVVQYGKINFTLVTLWVETCWPWRNMFEKTKTKALLPTAGASARTTMQLLLHFSTRKSFWRLAFIVTARTWRGSAGLRNK